MIPKIIHYSWFGPKDIPADMIRLIDHWREVMPDYEFVPVFYPHLRAHETGRKIVCRLLLAKKKTNSLVPCMPL